MPDRVEVSRDLKKWAAKAGFSLTRADQDGRAVFSNDETCYFIGRGADDLLRVTASDRRGPEQLELAARSPWTIERYFYGLFGPNVRYYRDLAQAKPTEHLPGGYRTARLADTNEDHLAFHTLNRDYLAWFDTAYQDYHASNDADRVYLALIDDQHDVTAVDGFDEALAANRLSDLAVYLSHSPEEIKSSFEAVNGAPLLAVINDEGQGLGPREHA
jgi:Immunity protein 61